MLDLRREFRGDEERYTLNDNIMKLQIKTSTLENWKGFFERHAILILFVGLSAVSILNFIIYYQNGLGLAYNDARSHLDIGRRIVENLKPGFGQVGSVWLPLPHLLMLLTIWNDFMWHSGLSGALQSMVAYVFTGILIYLFLKRIGAGLFGRIAGVLLFASNINILYMQSTAMTELLLLGTMTAGAYELLMWHKEESMPRLIKSAFWIMLSTMIRYDGWFLFLFAVALIFIRTIRKGYKTTEGVLIMFATLGGFGIALWLLWNQMIFNDMFFFAFGPYSANAQQKILEVSGSLGTKHNLPFSIETYLYALTYNAGLFTSLLGLAGMIVLWFDERIKPAIRIATSALLAPFFFNIFALYLGHSVLHVQTIAGGSWFNVRYGLMMIPSIAIFSGYFMDRVKSLRLVLVSLLIFISIFTFANRDAVTIDDGIVGSSGKNVKEVSGWLHDNAKDKPGFVLISAAAHDSIIFSSGLPMSKFIHEGTGVYWDLATAHPERWARWIIVRTNDKNDSTFRLLRKNKSFTKNYVRVHSYPFADIYELKPELVNQLHTERDARVDELNKK